MAMSPAQRLFVDGVLFFHQKCLRTCLSPAYHAARMFSARTPPEISLFSATYAPRENMLAALVVRWKSAGVWCAPPPNTVTTGYHRSRSHQRSPELFFRQHQPRPSPVAVARPHSAAILPSPDVNSTVAPRLQRRIALPKTEGSRQTIIHRINETHSITLAPPRRSVRRLTETIEMTSAIAITFIRRRHAAGSRYRRLPRRAVVIVDVCRDHRHMR